MINRKAGLVALLFIVGSLSGIGLASAQSIGCGTNPTAITCTSLYQQASGVINTNSVNGLVGISSAESIFVLALGIIVLLAIAYVFVIKIIMPFLK
jgi:hypothetical protein